MADFVDVDIVSLDAAGDGLARHGQRLLTVPFTIPGERVRVRLQPARAGVHAAVLHAVLRASPHRVAPACRHFGLQTDHAPACGGCTWQHIAYPEQLRLKTDLVARLVRAQVPAAVPVRPMRAVTPENAPWHFRNKVHFVVGHSARGGDLEMGHYARGSRRVVPVSECPVHDARGNDVAFHLLHCCRQASARAVKGLVVRAVGRGSEAMATLVVTSEAERGTRAAARCARTGQAAPTSLHLNVHPRRDAFIFGRETRRLFGPDRVREDIGGVSFLISPTAFFQTNVRAAEVLVELVLAAVPPDAPVLDLYAGAGLFALPLARRGQPVVAVEESRTAVADGEASLRLSRLPGELCRFLARPVETALRTRVPAWAPRAAAVLDPPREGVSSSVVGLLCSRWAPLTIVYVSCNPETLARDLAGMAARRYTVRSIQPVDMFPHTPHIETVAVLSRD